MGEAGLLTILRRWKRNDVHVVSGADCFFLFLNLTAVQIGNLTLYRFDGFHPVSYTHLKAFPASCGIPHG